MRIDDHSLEALPVHDGGARLVVLLLGDPHLLEGGQRGQDGATDPHGVFPLRGSDDLDLHGGRGKSGDLLLHTIGDTRVHGGASGQHVVGVQVLPDVHVALHDRVVARLVDTSRFHTWGQEALFEFGNQRIAKSEVATQPRETHFGLWRSQSLLSQVISACVQN